MNKKETVQYHIYHAVSDKRFTEEEEQPRDYVGCVDATSIEEAYTLSQNSDESWNKHNSRCRSTSVGDIIIGEEKYYMVCNIGFKSL